MGQRFGLNLGELSTYMDKKLLPFPKQLSSLKRYGNFRVSISLVINDNLGYRTKYASKRESNVVKEQEIVFYLTKCLPQASCFLSLQSVFSQL